MKQGFKQTEIGLIPEDWQLVNLGDVISYTKGFAFKSANYTNDGIRVIRVSDTSSDKINNNTPVYISDSRRKEFKKWTLLTDDLILSTVGSKPPMYDSMVGNVVRVSEKHNGSLLNQNAVFLRSENDSLQLYIYYSFKKSIYIEHIEKIYRGNANQASITLVELFKYKIPLPPTLAEQKDIATALSDVDDLISSLDALIAKKKAIKQGAMQQLLTPPSKGGKRLDGFDGEWVETPLDEVAWYQEGPGLRKWQFTGRGIKVINITNLVDGYLDLEKTQRHISWDEFNKMYQHFEIDENDIVVASSGNSYCKTAVVRQKDLPLVMNTSVIRFKPKENLDYKLLLIFLKSTFFKDQIDFLITGGAQPNFGPAHLKKIIFNLPPTIEEQSAIAEILFDIDMELEELEIKKEKYEHIKQGMMQELLTGKTRLV